MWIHSVLNYLNYITTLRRATSPRLLATIYPPPPLPRPALADLPYATDDDS